MKTIHSQIIESRKENKFYSCESSKKEFSDFFKSRRSQNSKLIKKSVNIKEDQFVIFEPLVADLRKDSRLAMFGHFFILIRRITLLYMAMFVIGQ